MTAKRIFRTLTWITVVSAVLVLVICMVVYETRVNTERLLNNARGDDAFIYEDQTYLVEKTVKNYTKTLCILRRADNMDHYTFLPGESALWSDTAECFVYCDRKKLKICDIEGKNQQTLYRASGLQVSPIPLTVIDQYVVAKNVYRRSNAGIQGVGNFFLIDLTDGSILETTISADCGLTALCVEDGYLYYSSGSISERQCDIGRCCLETGSCESLTEIISNAIAQGCVIDGYLYFCASEKGFYRVPVIGGEAEKLNIDETGNRPFVEYNGKILFAHTVQENDDSFSMSVEAYDPAEQSAKELFRFPMEDYDSIVSIRVQNAVITVLGYDSTIFQSELNPYI